MHPVLFSYGPITLYSYGFMLALGVLIAIFFLRRRGIQNGFKGDDVTDCAVFSIISGIIGARILYVLQEWDIFKTDPISAIQIWKGGLIFYGGIGGALLFFFLFCRMKNIPFFQLADLFVPFIAFSHAFGRLGCFMNGCCYGRPTDLPWGVHFPDVAGVIHPVQLYEFSFLIILFFVLSRLYRRRSFDGQIFFLYFILYPIGRFFLEFLRGDTAVYIGKFRIFQVVSIAIIALALIGYIVVSRYRSKPKG